MPRIELWQAINIFFNQYNADTNVIIFLEVTAQVLRDEIFKEENSYVCLDTDIYVYIKIYMRFFLKNRFLYIKACVCVHSHATHIKHIEAPTFRRTLHSV